ncbi:MAG TPA: tail fiber domain-containing protein [Candidatus Paceibacterota bacterium]|nr:tail fiber domain-containing protein [Candidatus Paceibacterota bacterium]
MNKYFFRNISIKIVASWATVIFVFATLLCSPSAALAISYTPGQTLNPACTPTDPTCVVTSTTNQAAIFVATSTTATSTFAGNVSVSGNVAIGSLSGILKAVTGVVTTALVNLSGDVTGILGISNGGTGTSTSPTYGKILVGNGSGGYNLMATSSLGIVTSSAVYATNYGVKCDGVTDDTAAMQAAANTGRVVMYPAGVCKFSTLVISSGGIIGEGEMVLPGSSPNLIPGGTVLLSTDTGSGNTISYVADWSTGNPGVFRNFSLLPSSGTVQKSGGVGIYISGNVSGDGYVNNYTAVDNILIRYFPTSISLQDSAAWTISNSNFLFYRVAGIAAGNLIAPDQGDSSIYATTLFNGNGGEWATEGSGILQTSSGGLKISDTKFNGGKYGYQWAQAGQTSDTLISNSSFENISTAAVDFQNTINTSGSPVRFTNIKITGNQFAGDNRDIYLEPISQYLGSSYWDNIVISGNTFYLATLSSIELDTAREFTIVGNTINGNYSTPVGILIASSDDATGFVGANNISGVGTAVVNNSATVTVSSSNSAVGAFNVSGTGAAYQLFGNTALFASTTNSSLAVGAPEAAGWMTASSSPQWRSIAIGAGALATTPINSAATKNIAVGYNALNANTSGFWNTAVGDSALNSNTSGILNVATGMNALNANTTGGYNVATGFQALYTNTTGSDNAAVGYNVLNNNLTAANTVAIGFSAAVGSGSYSNQGGVYIGYQAGDQVQTGSDYNTIIGYNAGYALTTGARNILIGQSTIPTSYNQVKTGSKNISIGNDVAVASSTASNQLDIGNFIYGTGLSGTGASVSPAYIGFGTTTPYASLEVWGSTNTGSTTVFSVVSSASTTLFSVSANGYATLQNSLYQSSDQRLKTDITTLDASSSLAALLALTPVSYTRIDQPELGTNLGFIAQQVQQIFPELVSTSSPTALTPDGTLTLNYTGLIAPIVKAIQAIASEIVSIQNTIAGFANSFTTKQLCLTDSSGTTCYTRSQLNAVVGNAATPSVQISTPTTPVISTTTPPTISIQGQNPATIHVGDTYTDLGALVTDNQGHRLGYTTYLNGTLVSTLTIDTSTTTTDTIDYVATDTWGNTATSTRTVIIAPVSSQ